MNGSASNSQLESHTEKGGYSEAEIKCFMRSIPLIVGVIRAMREVAAAWSMASWKARVTGE